MKIKRSCMDPIRVLWNQKTLRVINIRRSVPNSDSYLSHLVESEDNG